MSTKRIVYLTFYFRPDLCAGSFRNSPLVDELAKLAQLKRATIEVYTTLPNRYSTFSVEAKEFEQIGNVNIYRIKLPAHNSGMFDQVKSFWHYYTTARKLNKGRDADLVFASSSRLFTAFLGSQIASETRAPLYLDIRDIFLDSIKDVLSTKIITLALLPVLRRIEAITFRNAIHINLISPGFKAYFDKYRKPNYSFYTNGIDDEFLSDEKKHTSIKPIGQPITVVYAGNIGEGQGLHRIIPQVAQELGPSFQFVVIGDGGAKGLLVNEMTRLKVNNVKLTQPINRIELKKAYNNADYLFLHLNDYEAFKKVLPSKIFELATFKKPIIAGVAGYSATFLREEVPFSYVFSPCDANAMVDYLRSVLGLNQEIRRTDFIEKHMRYAINKKMAGSIISYLN